MIDQAKREEYLLACQAFGVDEEGRVGFDPTEKECDYCQGASPEMYKACEAEALASVADDVIPVEEPVSEEPVEVPETPEDAVEATEAVEEGKDTTEPEKPVTAKPKKSKKPKGKTQLDGIVEILLQKTPMTRKEIVEAVSAAVPGCTPNKVSGTVCRLMQFCLRVGCMEEDGDKRVWLK